MSRVRTLFLGTPHIASLCLEALIKDDHFEVVGVVTQPDRPAGRKMQPQPSPVKSLVEPTGIEILSPENINVNDVLARIAAMKAEAAVVVAYGQILSQNFLDLFPEKVVNVHASILPRWRGAAPIQRAIMAGDQETGVSLQVVVRKMDAGPVLAIRRFKIDDEMNAAEVYDLCAVNGAKLLQVDLMDYLRGNLTPQPQDESQVVYARKIEKAEAEIDWSLEATLIHNQVRGLAMGPVAQTHRNGKILKIHRTKALPDAGGSMRPGQVLKVTEKSLIVRCGTGSLDILEAQPESRAKMPIEAFLRGYPLQSGDLFGAKT